MFFEPRGEVRVIVRVMREFMGSVVTTRNERVWCELYDIQGFNVGIREVKGVFIAHEISTGIAITKHMSKWGLLVKTNKILSMDRHKKRMDTITHELGPLYGVPALFNGRNPILFNSIYDRKVQRILQKRLGPQWTERYKKVIGS